MAGPSEVQFPGKKKQKIRMRGTKKASGSVVKRLRRNLNVLLEEPESILPEVTGPTSRGFGRRDKMRACLKEIQRVILNREDRKWLHRRMAARKGDLVARALAGSMAAAHEPDFDTVAVFKHPVYGSSSFLRRGSGRPAHLLGLQMHSDPVLRLLAWEELARSGYWFFAWGERLVCTGLDAVAPTEWLESGLESSPLGFKMDDGGIWRVGSDETCIRMEFNSGSTVEVGLQALAASNDGFIQNLALTVSPPRISELAEVTVRFSPEGWPAEMEVSDSAKEAMDAVLERWMRLEIPDSKLQEVLHSTFAEQLESGFMLGRKWFAEDDVVGFLTALQGSEIEIEAVSVVLDSLDTGVRVDAAGEAHWLASDVVRVAEESAHTFLKAIWAKHGLDVLEEMFELSGDAADEVYEQQLTAMKGFRGFLTKIDEMQSNVRMLKMFPWGSDQLPTPLDFADTLVKTARSEGVGKTIGMARKRKDGAAASLGWAWVTLHGKADGEAWHYEASVRDRGGDWVPALSSLWQASESVVSEGDKEGYLKSMRELHSATGTIEALPTAE